MNTRVGSIAKLLSGQNKKATKCFCLPDPSVNYTPLQQSLESLGVKIGYLAIAVCLIVFAVGAILGNWMLIWFRVFRFSVNCGSLKIAKFSRFPDVKCYFRQ